MENVSEKGEHLCPWAFLEVRVYPSLRSVCLCFWSCSLGLTSEEGISGYTSNPWLVQQSICSGDKFPTSLGALFLRAAFLQLALKWYHISICSSSKAMQLCVLISYASPWMWCYVRSALALCQALELRMSSQTFIATCSGTWQKFSKAPSELRHQSQKSMLYVVLLTGGWKKGCMSCLLTPFAPVPPSKSQNLTLCSTIYLPAAADLMDKK